MHQRRFFRLLTDSERFALQGHPTDYARFLNNKAASRSMTGNAFGIPMVASVVAPLLLQSFQPKPIMSVPAVKRLRASYDLCDPVAIRNSFDLCDGD